MRTADYIRTPVAERLPAYLKTILIHNKMEIVFLEDGRQAKLIAKTDKGYVVDPMAVYQDYETEEEYTEETGNVVQVSKVFKVAPLDVVNAEYKEVLDKIAEQEAVLCQKRSELSKAKHELSQIEKQKTDLGKMIINRTELVNAKRLIVWIKDRIAPRVMDVRSSLKLIISYTVSRYESEEKCWAYSTWSDYENDKGWSTYSEYFDPEYGVKADLTDDEILQITHQRQLKNKFDSYALKSTDPKWLTPENIEKRSELNEQENKNMLKVAEKNLAEAQEKYNKLAGLVTV